MIFCVPVSIVGFESSLSFGLRGSATTTANFGFLDLVSKRIDVITAFSSLKF